MTDLIPKKKGFMNWIKSKTEGKPVTREEIEELKMKVVKARLQADLDESKAISHKAKTSRSMDTLNALFGPMDGGSEYKRHEDSEAKKKLRRDTLGF